MIWIPCLALFFSTFIPNFINCTVNTSTTLELINLPTPTPQHQYEVLGLFFIASIAEAARITIYATFSYTLENLLKKQPHLSTYSEKTLYFVSLVGLFVNIGASVLAYDVPLLVIISILLVVHVILVLGQIAMKNSLLKPTRPYWVINTLVQVMASINVLRNILNMSYFSTEYFSSVPFTLLFVLTGLISVFFSYKVFKDDSENSSQHQSQPNIQGNRPSSNNGPYIIEIRRQPGLRCNTTEASPPPYPAGILQAQSITEPSLPPSYNDCAPGTQSTTDMVSPPPPGYSANPQLLNTHDTPSTSPQNTSQDPDDEVHRMLDDYAIS